MKVTNDGFKDRLLEKILQTGNLNKAYEKVKSNKRAGGVDGMSVYGFLSH